MTDFEADPELRHPPFRLGYLETELLEWLWQQEWVDVKSAHQAIGRPRGLTRNTLQSTLERLVRKGLVGRERRGRAYHYRVSVARETWVRESLVRTLEGVPGADAPLLLASFVDVAERVDDAGLAELERLVRERRRALEVAASARDERDAGRDRDGEGES